VRRIIASDHVAALADMTGGIVHDFRTILAVIDAGAAVAERRVHDPEQVRMCLAGIRDGVQRGLKLTARLLDFVHGHQSEPQPEDLNELLRSLHAFLNYGAGPQVRIVMDLAPSVPACLIDAAQLNAALLNLVVNARDAMPNGGNIRIATSVKTSHSRDDAAPRTFVRLSVSDEGQGMSSRVLRKVFEPYFTTKGKAGTGLGVPQVCAFVKRMGGDVTVQSARGVGTTFDLVFPAHGVQASAGASVWRQVDRWVNEGGAGDNAPQTPSLDASATSTAIARTLRGNPVCPRDIKPLS
jgi:signal transduction histidine kinase